jgi:hypothetical protein
MNDALHAILMTNLHAGWFGMLGGVLSGSAIGLYFHREEWLGGYGSFPRRMLRLGHISFFGLGFLNLLFALTLASAAPAEGAARVASWGFLAGAVLMPACCYLCAWRKPLWILFPLPVTCLGVGTAAVLLGFL